MKLMMEQKQMLKMVMTTELRQAIELLQLSTYELMQFVQQEAEENPFIEFTENDVSPITYNKKGHRKNTYQTVDPLEFATRNEKGMHEQLLEQLMWMDLADDDYRSLHYIILNINEQGMLMLTYAEIANHLGMAESKVLELKKILHRLEPKGIGATSLSECLLIQAYEKFPDDVFLHTLIEKYLPLLADKQWKKIAKQCQVSLAEINHAFEKIQVLNPRPAAVFGEKAEYVTPDITITFDEIKNMHQVQLNDHYIPNLHFNKNYSQNLPRTGEVSKYIQNHLNKFEWLQKSILQRRNTIMKVMEVIIRHQEAFLQKGFRFLSPLTLREVATEIGMHESTVSRATANKVVQTPSGTFELRHLFSTKLTTACGSSTSQTTVKEMIRELVDKEDKHKPLSDQKIAERLKQNKDVVISRRTVAKYRDELQIPSSSKRKEFQVV